MEVPGLPGGNLQVTMTRLHMTKFRDVLPPFLSTELYSFTVPGPGGVYLSPKSL